MVAGRPAGDACNRRTDFPTNRGGLCAKGWTAADLLDHPDRLLTPLVRAIAGDRPAAAAGDLGRGPRPDRRRRSPAPRSSYGRGRRRRASAAAA